VRHGAEPNDSTLLAQAKGVIPLPSDNPVIRPDDIQAAEQPWGGMKWLMSAQVDPDTELTFGVVFILAGQCNPEHLHPNSEELFYLLSGECDHTLEDKVYHMTAGQLIRIPPGVRHHAINTGWEPLRIITCFSTGRREAVTVGEGKE